MKVIKRPRQSGKTTILLHYMTIDTESIYVGRTEEVAKQAFHKSQELGLKIDRQRFRGMTSIDLGFYKQNKILVDDAHHIIACHPELGYKLMACADIITITEE